jgi:3-methyladenine DNA glycosylase/8-oxoguanine DNA glycosylase
MRAMEWPDAFLETDAGVKKALLPYKPKELPEMAETWRPWRSYATVNLWLRYRSFSSVVPRTSRSAALCLFYAALAAV